MTRQSKNFSKAQIFLIPPLNNIFFIMNHLKNFSEYPIFYHCAKNLPLGLIDPKWKFYILDFTLWTKSTVSNSQKDKLIGFFQGQFWAEPWFTFQQNLDYFVKCSVFWLRFHISWRWKLKPATSYGKPAICRFLKMPRFIKRGQNKNHG